MKNNYIKNVIITASITAFIFLFILTLIYIIYCYAIYDSSLKNDLIDNFNLNKYDYIYDHLKQDDEYLIRENYNNIINQTFDYNYLSQIYELYYKESYTEKDFFNKYYYGGIHLDKDSFTFDVEGKTSLFKRANINYNKININNGHNSTTFGIINNVKFILKEDSLLYIDNQGIECDNECSIDNVYGGIHTIKYINNGYTFFGLININEDNQMIEISKIESLVILEKAGNVSTNTTNKNNNKLIVGDYVLKECYLSSSCPTPKYAYITLNEDNTVKFYYYITLDMAGDTYYGTYTIKNGFLTLSFDSHTYRVHDYDTGASTDIEATTNIEYTFKILENNEFQNENYKFRYQE